MHLPNKCRQRYGEGGVKGRETIQLKVHDDPITDQTISCPRLLSEELATVALCGRSKRLLENELANWS